MTLNLKKATRTKAAYTLELINRAKEYPIADVDNIDKMIDTLQFKQLSIVLPPYMIEMLNKAERIYSMDDPDDLILTAIDEWLEKRKKTILGENKYY
jgi:DNA replication protein DnaD